MATTNSTNKKVYFEMMRVIACSLVIFNHVRGHLLFTTTEGAEQFWSMTLTMSTRFALPIFFMISGALLLGRSDEWTKVFRKRFIRVMILVMLFDFIQMCVTHFVYLSSDKTFDISFIRWIYGFIMNDLDGTGPYWYMYGYMGVLFVLPLLQRLAKGITRTEMIALTVLHFIMYTLLPAVNILLMGNQLPELTIYDRFMVPFAFEKPFFYTLLGYYVETNIDVKKIRAKHVCGLIAASVAGTLISDLITYGMASVTGEFTQDYVEATDYVTAVVVFILIKYLYVVVKPSLGEGKSASVVCFLGSLTLGIYMMDPVFRLACYRKFERALPYHTLIVSLIWIILSMSVGGTLTFILKKLPLTKKLF